MGFSIPLGPGLKALLDSGCVALWSSQAVFVSKTVFHVFEDFFFLMQIPCRLSWPD